MSDPVGHNPEDVGGFEGLLPETDAAEVRPPLRPRGLLSNAMWSSMALVSAGLVSFVTIGIVRRAIGTNAYGLYLILAMIGGFLVLLDLGLGEATLKYVAQYHSRNDMVGVNRVVGATLMIYTAGGLIGGAVIIVAAPWIVLLFKLSPEEADQATTLLRIAGVAFILTPVVGALRTIPEAAHRFDVGSKFRIVMELVRGVVMIVVVKLGYGLFGLIVWMVGYQVLNLVGLLIVVVVLLPGIRPWPHPTRRGMREVFGYGIFSFVNEIVGTLSVYIDRLILAMFFGTAAVAYLGVPRQLLTQAAGVYSAAGRPLFPKFSAMEPGPGMQHLFLFSTWCMLCLSLVLFVPTMVIMPEFMRLWQGAEFAEHSSDVAIVIASVMSLQGAFIPYYGLLKGTGRIHWLTFVYLASTGLGVVAALVLVPLFGVMGGGYRLWVTIGAGYVVFFWVSRRLFPEVRLHTLGLRVLLPSLLVSLVVGGVFWFAWRALDPHGWLAIIVAWLIMAAVLLGVLCAVDRVIGGPDGPAAELYRAVRAWTARRRGRT